MTKRLGRTARFEQLVEELDNQNTAELIAKYGDLRLTRRDSLMARNCETGTDRFIEWAKHFEVNDGEGITARAALTLHDRLYSSHRFNSSRYWVVACIAMVVLRAELKAERTAALDS